MNEINVDVILPNEQTVIVTSPTYSTQACVILPQGPQGPQGESAIGGTGIVNTGEFDARYVNLTGNEIISGNKTFLNSINASGISNFNYLKLTNNIDSSGTGIFKALDLKNIDVISLNNIDIGITNGNVISNYPIEGSNLVYKTGDQIITGLKDFTTRPTVNTIPVLLSGEHAYGLSLFVKNYDTGILYKSQPVYIYGAAGNNILVRMARNTGESTSSKTIGLLAQNLAINELGYVITEGGLDGLDTSMANAGDPIWLGPTGNLIYGLTNKPYAPNHLVYIGVVERSQSNNGKIYIKVQNGFELQELHNVNIDHYNQLTGNQILKYNLTSGLWFNDTLSSLDLSNSNKIVYVTGNQNISGNKVFSNNLEIQGTGIFNSLDLSNISDFNFSGTNISLLDSSINLTGLTYMDFATGTLSNPGIAKYLKIRINNASNIFYIPMYTGTSFIQI